ncbi:M15 family metallopeptidase [Paenibacillus sp. NFR01]|uniref:M15 family metallopeptidase n=1 Tax=Paenibacillus sp. NFR01 TaxID=1566279 RepID=UPI0008D0CC2D|nr:M15 family metallopeptidase [Paenibacillus sp. NFR01]SEU32841.1 peptidoglycan L-alanyl-D-glutamate endopeptidase CwlK [Paenibacillus sp. NFR01]
MAYTLEQVKAKSAARLAGLEPAVRQSAVALIEFAYAHGVPIIITQGLRTSAEQDKLYAQGRTAPGQIVTNAPGGYSYHNFGVAIDFALLLPDGSVSWDTRRDGDGDGIADWSEVVADAKRLGWEWGGDWSTFKDLPHFELNFGLSTADFRAGKRPTAAQLAEVLGRFTIIEGEADELTDAEKKRLDTLEAAVAELGRSRDVLKDQVLQQAGQSKDLTGRVVTLEGKASLAEIPSWAKTAVEAAVAAGLINTPSGGSYDFYRLLVIMERAGLLADHQ